MDDREISNVYAVPANFTDSGKLLGGMLETRNTIETGFLLLLVGYPEIMWLSLPAAAKVVVMTLTLLPLCVVGLMGVGGDSLMQCAAHVLRFLLRRRKLHLKRVGYNYNTDYLGLLQQDKRKKSKKEGRKTNHVKNEAKSSRRKKRKAL